MYYQTRAEVAGASAPLPFSRRFSGSAKTDSQVRLAQRGAQGFSPWRSTVWHSPVGALTLAGDDDALTGLWIAGQKYFGRTLPDDAEERDDAPVFRQAKDWLESYFAGEKPSLSRLPLAPAGGTFRRQVWEILCNIPYGTVATYGEIGKMLADQTGKERMSAQAIGGAVGHNPISIIIPCHRVVGANGSLTGYAGGLQAKARLLELEGVQMSRLFVPKTGTAL